MPPRPLPVDRNLWCRSGGGTSDYSQPVSGVHDKSVESSPSGSMDVGSQKDRKGLNFWETKMGAQLGANAHRQSPYGENAPCVTSNTLDEVSSPKKMRLGWGEGLAKYEKKVNPDDKEAVARYGMVDGGSSSEPLLPSPSNEQRDVNIISEKSSRKKTRLGWGEGLAKYEKKVNPDDKEAVARYGMVDGGSSSEPLLPSPSIEQRDLNIKSRKAECLQDNVTDDMLEVAMSSGDGSQVSIDSSRKTIHYGREEKLYDLLSSNKIKAKKSSDEFSKLLPNTNLRKSILRTADESLIKKRISMKKRFLKFRERVITLQFQAFQYFWKKDPSMPSMRRFGASSSSLVPTTEMIEYAKKLLSHSHMRIYRNTLKMPTLLLDRRRFISDNGLVKNPLHVERGRSIMKSWTTEEKDIFLDKYSLFGKDMRKIASFLQHKRVSDCVEFYYKNHKSDYFPKKMEKSVSDKSDSDTTNTKYLITARKRKHNLANCPYILSTIPATIAMFCDELETDAEADVLAGIIGYMSPSDALDAEKSIFIEVVGSFGKDFSMISQCKRTRCREQWMVFFRMGRKCIGLDVYLVRFLTRNQSRTLQPDA